MGARLLMTTHFFFSPSNARSSYKLIRPKMAQDKLCIYPYQLRYPTKPGQFQSCNDLVQFGGIRVQFFTAWEVKEEKRVFLIVFFVT